MVQVLAAERPCLMVCDEQPPLRALDRYHLTSLQSAAIYALQAALCCHDERFD